MQKQYLDSQICQLPTNLLADWRPHFSVARLTLFPTPVSPVSHLSHHLNHLQVQKEYLDSQIRQLSNSHVVQAGIQRQRQPMPGPPHMRVADLPVPIPPADVPGVKEAGWTPSAKPGYVKTGCSDCTLSSFAQNGAVSCVWQRVFEGFPLRGQ